MQNHMNSLVLPSECAVSIFGKWRKSHHALSGYNKDFVIFKQFVAGKDMDS